MHMSKCILILMLGITKMQSMQGVGWNGVQGVGYKIYRVNRVTVGRMYKGLEPIRLEHLLWMVRSLSEICPKCPKFPKFPNFVRSSGIVFIEILPIFDNYHILECFWKKKTLKFWEKFFVCKQTLDE